MTEVYRSQRAAEARVEALRAEGQRAIVVEGRRGDWIVSLVTVAKLSAQ